MISGNRSNGVLITGNSATRNVVDGNLIGTTADGYSPVIGPGGQRQQTGVNIQSVASFNTVGGSAVLLTAGVKQGTNVISGNSELGIRIDGQGTTGNVVQGNIIGPAITGNVPLQGQSDQNEGIFVIRADSNTIGGSSLALRNLISANKTAAIEIYESPNNLLLGNWIGPRNSGIDAFLDPANQPIQAEGIRIVSSLKNTIGGAGVGAGNLISGNRLHGVHVQGTTETQIVGNFIGTDRLGTGPVPNGQDGLLLERGSALNVIDSNLISGNGANGIEVIAAGPELTGFNFFVANLIGTDQTGTLLLGNRGNGIRIDNSPSNTIGDPNGIARNTISANSLNGVEITGPRASGNQVTGNDIGTAQFGTPALLLGNGGAGILFTREATQNSVSKATVAFNRGAGIRQTDGAKNNFWDPNFSSSQSPC